jgi:hypothetical protein
MYREPSPAIAKWLKAHRASMRGVDRVKVWQWFEGWDHTGLNAALIEREVVERNRAMWADFQRAIPGLLERGVRPEDENTRQAIRERLSILLTEPLADSRRGRGRGGLVDILDLMSAAMGVPRTPDPLDEDALAALRRIESATEHSSDRVPLEWAEAEAPGSLAGLDTFYGAIPEAVSSTAQLDLARVRFIWQGMSAAVEVLSSSDLSKELHRFRPYLPVLCYIQRRLYRQPPEVMVNSLTSLGALFPIALMKREARLWIARRDALRKEEAPAATD